MADKSRALIEVDLETKQTLDAMKVYPDESYGKVISRLIRLVTPEQLSKALTEDFKMKNLDVDLEWAKHLGQMEDDIKKKSFDKAEKRNKRWKKRLKAHKREEEQ